jgi:hypothetical protein
MNTWRPVLAVDGVWSAEYVVNGVPLRSGIAGGELLVELRF